MKASELIYRLAKAIEKNGDCELKMTACVDERYNVECEFKCLDIVKTDNGTCFELRGEE